jgi:fumarate hydratase subunit alpha
MAISYQLIKSVTAQLYDASLRKIPEETKLALRAAELSERNDTARKTIRVQLESAAAAEKSRHFVCSDSGVPVYFVKIGTRVQFDGDVKRAIVDGFDELVKTIQPPLLQHVTHPLTLERGYKGKDMPIVSYDLIDGADYIDIVCSPKALGSGRWAALELFSFPSLEQIEKYVLEVVIRAGSQACPPVMIGVGIGGTFDYAAKMAKEAVLRPAGEHHPEQIVAAMETRLLKAVNATGFGPMGTGGDSTALAVHINYSAGHGFTPVAVCFNCWINRKARARIYNDGRVEYSE